MSPDKPVESDSNTIEQTANFAHRKQSKYAVLLLCSLSIVAFIIACQLSIANTSYDKDETLSLSKTLLGDSRMALSAKFYTQADLYFHRGAPHKKQKAFYSDPFQRIYKIVRPTKHVHLSGKTKILEIMPWLNLSIRANPQNLDSYLVAAFWLSDEALNSKEALKILELGQRNIPYSYEIQLAKGRLLLHLGEFDQARQAFDAALAFWNHTADPTNKDALLDKSKILLYRALLYEDCGKINKAIEDIRNMLVIKPDNPMMQDRLKNLQAGIETQPSADDLLTSILKKQDKESRECDRDHDHDDHDHENH